MAHPQKSYFTGLESLDQQGKTANFYLLNTSPNGNNWAVSPKALDEALTTLLGKPIGLGINYELGHSDTVGEMRDVGIFVTTENKGNYALGTAKITDQKALEMLKAGLLGPVSVILKPYRASCSKCHKSYTSKTDGHLCPDAHEVLESFVFERVDFVKTPSYPQAGLLTLAASCIQSNSSAPLPLLAAAYEGSQTSNNNKKTNKCLGETKFMSETEKIQIAKLETNFATLSASVSELTAKNVDLEKRLAAFEKEQNETKKAAHTALVEKALAVRKAANIGEETVDRINFATFNASALKTVIADADKALETKKADKNNGSKGVKKTDQAYTETDDADNTSDGEESDLTALSAAVNKRRNELGLPTLKAVAAGEEGQ